MQQIKLKLGLHCVTGLIEKVLKLPVQAVRASMTKLVPSESGKEGEIKINHFCNSGNTTKVINRNK